MPATQEKEKLKVGDLVSHMNSALVKQRHDQDGYEYGIVTHTDCFLPYQEEELYRVWWIRLNRHHSCYLPSWQLKKLS